MTIPAVPTSPLTNLRDLGGIPVRGGVVRTGALLRSDDVSYIDDASARMLTDDGLGLIVDLRSTEETRMTGRGVFSEMPVDYVHLPLTDAIAAPVVLADWLSDAADPERAMGGWYASLLEARADLFVEGFARIVATPGATLFHCAAGKDRTGVFAASILSVLEADDDMIVADYARTGDALAALFARIEASLGPRLGGAATHDVPPVLLTAPAGAMSEMLAAIKGRHGSVTELLRDAGLDESLTRELRNRLVVSA